MNSSSPMTPRPSGRRSASPVPHSPPWIRVGDRIALGVVLVLVLGGMLHRGYAAADLARAWAYFACVALGLWSLAGWAAGRWSSRECACGKWILLLMGLGVFFGGLQLIPLPASFVRSVSPLWDEILHSFAASGIEAPARIPLAIAPEKGLESWNQWVASALFFSGVFLLAMRKTGFRSLAWLMGLLAVAEGIFGVFNYTLGGAQRGYGALYNPNHHAVFVFMGLPIYLASVRDWRRRKINPDFVLGGSDPLLLFAGLFVLALIGALVSFSRGTLILGCGILVGWILVEMYGAWRSTEEVSGGYRGRAERGWKRIMESLFLLLLVGISLTALVFFSSLAGGFRDRFATPQGPVGRWDLVQATWRGLEQSRYLGYGLGGTEFIINRHAQWPTTTNAIWTHNDYVQVAAELGIPALLGIGVALVGLLRSLWRVRRDPVRKVHWRDGHFARAAMAGMLIALAQALSDFHLRVPLITFQFLILSALAIHANRHAPRIPEPAVPFQFNKKSKTLEASLP